MFAVGALRLPAARELTISTPDETMRRPRFFIVAAWASGMLLFAAAAAADTKTEAADFFQQQVAPLLTSKCLSCHGSDAKGELDLRSGETAMAGGESGPVILPGKPQESLLYEHVAAAEMPPEEPLSSEEIAVLRRWIEKGAYYPDQPLDPLALSTDLRAGYDWWSLQPLKAPEVPTVATAPKVWQKSPIDRFIFKKLEAAELTPAKPASPRVLIRRASYDLTGLPPTPAETAAFLSACQAETGVVERVGDAAYAALLERLLASPRYGEHWGRHWLDVVRFGESNGYERNAIINNVWPFRDYVIRSLNEDKPFDQLATEHLAGDMIGSGKQEVEVGTAFLVCGPYDDVSNQDPERAAQIRADTIDEIIRTTGEAFLGLTVGCSRCHDHKFDPISQEDYYQFYATFSGVSHGSRLVASKEDRRAYQKQKQEREAKKKGADRGQERDRTTEHCAGRSEAGRV
jgi:mono/diheme cytochrome c family protein